MIIVVVVNGVRAPFERLTQGSAPAGVVPEAQPKFPVAKAEAFAVQFAQVYLNFDGAKPDVRAGRLAAYLPDGAPTQFGWDGLGKMEAGAIQPYETKVTDDRNAVVVLLFQSGNRRMMLSVPVFASGGGLVVPEYPAVLPAPAKAAFPSPPEESRDEATEVELRPQLQGFFEKYAEGDPVDLQRFVAADVRLESFDSAFDFVSLDKVHVPPGGNVRKVRVEVTWSVPSAGAQTNPEAPAASEGKLEQAYDLIVEKQSDKWYIKEISGASRTLG
ncbi:conjugal transfer protein [Sinosporangium siamense]|uniref:conjugal transfer protein n=1 Tax=Sinosporangium siamense TaxID=1367973 RepID=UPI001EF37084|nr:conjugal transfer protein [Sinosporangium siamense]